MLYLLDTNHCIYLMNGSEKTEEDRSQEERNVIQAIQNLAEDDCLHMAQATLGELYYGATLSARKLHNKDKINVLKTYIQPFALKDGVWELFGETKALLRQQGKAMQDFDLLIACTAKVYNCTLVTNDQDFNLLPDHFPKVNWASGVHQSS